MSDNNFESYWGEKNFTIENRIIAPDNPTSFNDILKLSHCENIVIKECQIEGGSEDCIDALAGKELHIINTRLRPNGRNGITLKGAIEEIGLDNVVFLSHGSECDIELGQHTIYDTLLGRDKTKRVHLTNVTSNDGKPVIVRVWNADKPGITGGNVKLIIIPKIIVKIYFLWRWIQIHWLKK